MKQLLMKWVPAVLPEAKLPEGFLFHRWHRGGDDVFSAEEFKRQWTSMRIPAMGDEAYNWYRIVHDDMRVPNDGFFLIVTKDGKMVSSACVQIGEHTPDSATVHAVCTDESYRGLGLGRANMLTLLKYVRECGFPEAYLTTDDWRIPAVKLYLHLGFMPVLYEADMRGRWKALLRTIGEKEASIVDENGLNSILYYE